jgi:hypothetical protein
VTTPLIRRLTREILVSGMAYKLVLMADRLLLTPKGRRKAAIEVTWDQLLTLYERTGDSGAQATPAPAIPKTILSEIALEVRTANVSLTRAEETLIQAGVLPPELRATMRTDTIYGPSEDRADWYIEPLLTEAEVASIVRLSARAIRRLGIRSISLQGEIRYRQSEVREFLRRQESQVR